MCLRKLDNFTPCRVGYQVKRKRLSTEEYGSLYYSGKSMKVGEKFLGSGKVIGDFPNIYQSGPHVFHKKRDAVKYLKHQPLFLKLGYSVVKVRVHGAYAVGWVLLARVAITKFVDIDIESASNNKLAFKWAKVTVAKAVTLLKEEVDNKKQGGDGDEN